MKKVIALLLTAIMVISLAGCGAIDVNKIKGEWTTKSINGTEVQAYADSVGLTLAQTANNVTIGTDDKITFTNANAAESYTYKRAADGIEIYKDGAIYLSMKYDAAADTLTYAISDGTNTMTLVLKKGTTDLTVAAAPAEEEAADDTADEEAYDEAGDEEAADDTADEEAYDEAGDEEAAE